MATIKLYRNTRFNGVNIPHSLYIVEHEGTLVKSITNGNIIQGEGLNYIDVSMSSQEATAVDFIIVEGNDGKKVGYTPSASHETSSPNVVRFYLYCMALSTILPTIDIMSGSANRLTIDPIVDDEQYFTNVEPFKPAEENICVPVAMDSRVVPTCYNILETISIPPQMYKRVLNQFNPISNQATNLKLANSYEDKDTGYMSDTAQYAIARLQRGGTQTARLIKDVDTNAVISTSIVATEGDDILRKLYPTQVSFPGLNALAGTTISTGTRWWLEQDIPSKTASWDTDNLLDGSSIINDLRTRGYDNNITAMWSVPTFYVASVSHTQYDACADGKTDNVGGITAISASKLDNHIDARPIIGYQIKNNKCKYGQDITLTVFNPVSGMSLTKQLWEISNPTNTPASDTVVADYSISADIRQDGCPIFSWKYQHGNELIGFPETIQGGNWRQIPISGEGGRGSYWQQRQIDIANRENRKNLAGNVIGGIIQGVVAGATTTAPTANPIAVGVGSAVGGIVGGVSSFIKQDNSIKEQQETLNQQGAIAEAELSISTSNYVRDCGYNAFYGYYSVFSMQDVKDFDMFLTKFGYNVGNKEFTKDDLYTRDGFNYVKANDCHISSGQWSSYLIDQAIKELKQGVRIWHTIPDEDYYINGNQAHNRIQSIRKGETNGQKESRDNTKD